MNIGPWTSRRSHDQFKSSNLLLWRLAEQEVLGGRREEKLYSCDISWWFMLEVHLNLYLFDQFTAFYLNDGQIWSVAAGKKRRFIKQNIWIHYAPPLRLTWSYLISDTKIVRKKQKKTWKLKEVWQRWRTGPVMRSWVNRLLCR